MRYMRCLRVHGDTHGDFMVRCGARREYAVEVGRAGVCAVEVGRAAPA